MSNSEQPGAGVMFVYRIAFVAAIGGFLFGFDLGMIGAANLYLRDQFHLSDAQFGLATASAGIGCILGPFLGAWLCDAIGRKRTMIVAAFLLALSAIVTATPEMLSGSSDRSIMTVFNIFRAIGGLGVGLCSIASPMYIAEVAPPKKRGRLGLMYQLAIVCGHIVAPAIGYLVVISLPQSDGVAEIAWQQPWRWMFASETVCVLVFVSFVFSLPRSPRWLAEEGRHEEALKVLSQVEGPDYARREIEQIRSSLEQEAGGWGELLAPGMRYAMLIGILLAFFNNWTGWSIIGAYIPVLFEMSGLEDRAAAIGRFALTYGAMGLMTVVSLVLMDRVGRRPLWMFASLLMAVITCATGLVFHLELTGSIVLIVIMLCTVPHGIALGGIPWLMMSELFPTRVRAKAVSITTTFLWVAIFSGAYLFPALTTVSTVLVGSVGVAFWLFTVICILSFLFGWWMMPETKGRTLEEIAESWKKP
ncbi:MAG TPA: sugar porter family MFS transporter [Pirellulaceae bacterium]|nr:sugar porter family MFS transporter [Pirellulaceae bacterium]